MNRKADDFVFHKSSFAWIALGSAALLLIPLVAMRFSTDVRWDALDFIVMGAMLFGTASLFVLAARKTARRHRVFVGVAFVVAFLFVWAELAVGIFSNFGR